MPYDKNGKYYRQPVYNRNFISGKVNEKKLTYEEEADNEEFEEADNDAFNARLLRNVLLSFTGVIGILLISGLIRGTINLQPNSNRQNPKNDTPSIEETLDNMLQYQKEKDSRRRQEMIIDKFIDKEMNSW